MEEFNLKNKSIQLNPENHSDVAAGGVYLESIDVPVSRSPVSTLPCWPPAQGKLFRGTRCRLGDV